MANKELKKIAEEYATNRRNESYDIESELLELDNGCPIEKRPGETQRLVADARTEAFLAGYFYSKTGKTTLSELNEFVNAFFKSDISPDALNHLAGVATKFKQCQ